MAACDKIGKIRCRMCGGWGHKDNDCRLIERLYAGVGKDQFARELVRSWWHTVTASELPSGPRPVELDVGMMPTELKRPKLDGNWA